MTNKKTKIPPIFIFIDSGGGGFDGIFNHGGGRDGDRECDFVMTVRSTKRASAAAFDAQFKSSGQYDFANLVDEGDFAGAAINIQCVSKTAKTVKYKIYAYVRRFGAIYFKIRTGFWLKFSLEAHTENGKFEDLYTLIDVLIPDELPDMESTWGNFAPEGSWEAVRWVMRDLRIGISWIPSMLMYTRYSVREHTKDPMVQSLIADRKYVAALKQTLLFWKG